MSDSTSETSNKKKGLGRGLGSLLGGAEGASEGMHSKTVVPHAATLVTQTKPPSAFAGASAHPTPSAETISAVAHVAPVSTEGKVWQVAIDKLNSGAYQPRKSFEKESLKELAQSIKENGILQPITARKVASGKLEIIAGERRWRAAQLAGLHEVPVLIKNFNDRETLELSIIENVQREDLNPIEEAEGYARLINEFKLSQQQVADKVGKDRATVANAVRLLGLSDEVRKMVVDESLSVGHAKVLLSLADPKRQLELAKKVVSEKLAVRKLEKMVQEAQNPSPSQAAKSTIEQNVTQRLIEGLCDELQKILGTKVNIDYANSKGKITVHFYSDDELTQIVDRLKQGWQK